MFNTDSPLTTPVRAWLEESQSVASGGQVLTLAVANDANCPVALIYVELSNARGVGPLPGWSYFLAKPSQTNVLKLPFPRSDTPAWLGLSFRRPQSRLEESEDAFCNSLRRIGISVPHGSDRPVYFLRLDVPSPPKLQPEAADFTMKRGTNETQLNQ